MIEILDGIAQAGARGASGIGVIPGGTIGQTLSKASGADYDMAWSSAGSGDVIAANNLSDIPSPATARTNLGVDAAGTDNSTNVTLAGTGTYISLAGQVITVDPITESDITDLGTYLTDITGEALSTLSDVTITTIASGELLKWNGSAWINNTLAEAGISATGHGHTESDISDLTHYTNTDWDTQLGTKTTDNLTEGATNLYFSAAEATKLSNIEALADVTDATNVAAAGAVMDSELINSTAGVGDAGKPIKLNASGVIDSSMYTDTDTDTTDHTALSNIGTNTHAQIDTKLGNSVSHIASTSNPHSVTAAQVGNATAQWNADKLAGVTIDDALKGDGKVLQYSLGTDTFVYSAAGSGDLVSTNNLSDLANAATARTNLGVDAAGTDNSTDVTLAGTGTYISIVGQVITVDPITESDITDLGSYLTSETSHADVVVDGDFASNGIMKRTASGVYGIVTDNSTNWNTAFGWGDHASAGYLTSQTSHADVLVDGDFGTAGLMKTDGAGAYSIVTDASANWNTAHGWGDHAQGGYLTDITGEALSTLSDVTITTIASGELLKWDGLKWINNTLAEAGISATGHGHTASDVSDFDTEVANNTAVAANTAKTGITAGQASAIVTNTAKVGVTTEISDITGEPLSDLSDVTITTIASGELLKWNGTAWINNTLAEAGISATGHGHTASDISDFDTEVSNNASVAANTSKISYTDATKVSGIETGADVTDATNVNAAGATMNSDTTMAGNGYFLDEDAMTSDSATKVASQQSIKAYVDSAVAGVSGESLAFDVAQTAHGLVVGNVIKSSGTDGQYAKAQADSAANAEVVGIVTVVTDVNNFTMVTSGTVDVVAVVPTETAGTVLFLSEATAGLLTTTEPSGDGEISKPIAVVTASNAEMQLVQMRGQAIVGGTTYPNNPYSFRARDSVGTTLTDAAEVQIDLATEEYDYNNDFASDTYTAPVDGVYHFDAALVSSAVSSVVAANIRLKVNSDIMCFGGGMVLNAGFVHNASMDVIMSAGDTATMHFYHNSGATETASNALGATWFSGHLVHAT